MLLFSNGNVFVHWKTKRRHKGISYNYLSSSSLPRLKHSPAALTSAMVFVSSTPNSHKELLFPTSQERKETKEKQTNYSILSLTSLNDAWYPNQLQYFWNTAYNISKQVFLSYKHKHFSHDLLPFTLWKFLISSSFNLVLQNCRDESQLFFFFSFNPPPQSSCFLKNTTPQRQPIPFQNCQNPSVTQSLQLSWQIFQSLCLSNSHLGLNPTSTHQAPASFLTFITWRCPVELYFVQTKLNPKCFSQ